MIAVIRETMAKPWKWREKGTCREMPWVLSADVPSTPTLGPMQKREGKVIPCMVWVIRAKHRTVKGKLWTWREQNRYREWRRKWWCFKIFLTLLCYSGQIHRPHEEHRLKSFLHFSFLFYTCLHVVTTFYFQLTLLLFERSPCCHETFSVFFIILWWKENM